MKPELLISQLLARKGVASQQDVMQLAMYARGMRDFGAKATTAYLAAEEFALRGGSRDEAQAALDALDDAIEAWAERVYGEGWRKVCAG